MRVDRRIGAGVLNHDDVAVTILHAGERDDTITRHPGRRSRRRGEIDAAVCAHRLQKRMETRRGEP